MKPFLHARGSVRRWGGKPEDYLAIHDFIDSSKAAMPDLRHRALYHHAMGCYLVERIFGHTIKNSDGREVSTRDVAEEHIIEDMGYLPSVEDWLDAMPMLAWMGGIHRIAKDARPPTPPELREATRARVREVIYKHDDHDHYLCAGDIPDDVADEYIAAVRGTGTKEED